MVTPLREKESKLYFVNCGSIPLLPVFSKIYERLFDIRIYSYLIRNNFIDDKHFGSPNDYATIHELLSNNRILVDSGQSLVFLLTFNKAYNIVNHNILCEKLN